MKLFGISLGFLVAVFFVNSALAADLNTEGKIAALELDLNESTQADDSADLVSGKVDAAEIGAATELADKIEDAVKRKFNQDSTDSLHLVIMIEQKLPGVKAIIDQDTNRAYIALSAMAEAFDIIARIDLLDQNMRITHDNRDSIEEIRKALKGVILNADKSSQLAVVRAQSEKLSSLGSE